MHCSNQSFFHAGVLVGFGESDYREIEGMLGRDIIVQKREANIADVVLTLTPFLFSELPGEDTNEVDPAECKYSRLYICCLLYTSPSPRDATLSRMPSSA